MMIFSKVHDWQDCPAVKQILVFPSIHARDQFEELHALEVARVGVESATDSNMGASFKIRAVRCGDRTFESMIRCGVSGRVIHTQFYKFADSQSTLTAGVQWLIHHHLQSSNALILELNQPT